MSLSSASTETDALEQYRDNLRYWESVTKAQNLYEAILWLLQSSAVKYNIAGREVTRTDLEKLRDEIRPIVMASATNVAETRLVGLGFGRAG